MIINRIINKIKLFCFLDLFTLGTDIETDVAESCITLYANSESSAVQPMFFLAL